ncbi:MAG: SpoIIE family protein phosphatase [Rhodospirillaceae bacterium]
MNQANRSTGTEKQDAKAQFADLRDARVMVVDDNRVNRHLLLALLERGGITQIDLAEDGEQALAKIGAFRPDLMLLDLMMPVLDGFEVCRRLRADPAYADLPILVQSSLNRAEDRNRAFTAGATDYVSKPINAVELLSRVRIHIQNRMLLNSLQLYRQRTAAELTLARKMQERLMPQAQQLEKVRQSLGLSLAAHFAPSSELGGDFWGMRSDDANRLVVWLVDFSGHGVGAALNTFRLHAILNQFDFAGFDPATFLGIMNRRLCPLLPTGQYATMLAGVIDRTENRFLYASAGATRPMAWPPGATAPTLGDNSGLPLGFTTSADYVNRNLPLGPGGRLFLYSDAAVELPIGNGQILDEAGLDALVVDHMAEPDGQAFLLRLLAALSARGDYDDDLTALVVTRER